MQQKTNKSSRLASLKAWIHKHPKRMFSLVIFGLVLASSLSVAALTLQKPEDLAVAVAKKIVEKKPVYHSPLSGEIVKNEGATTKPVTAIMIENSPDARPQSGLKEAEVVYEAIAEGGITRFLALYQQNEPKLVGPVRSLRMYYVDWLSSYDASVAHVGGSAKALKTVRGGGYKDLDQFFNDGTYWRATDRYAPHNVYTSFSRLNVLNKQKGYTSSEPQSFDRQDDTKTSPKQNATKLKIDISSPLYNSTYRYSSKTKLYTRSQAGALHKDREKGAITARVVIAMNVDMETVMEDGYRESINTIGSGKATVFQDGHAYKVTWTKPDRKSQITFKGADDQTFKLARGTTWITAIPNNGGELSWR